jgi:hypothetical protein
VQASVLLRVMDCAACAKFSVSSAAPYITTKETSCFCPEAWLILFAFYYVSLDSAPESTLPLAGEQTWPTEEELAAAAGGAKLRKRRLPAGTSEYQAAWILDDDEGSGGSEEEEQGEWSVCLCMCLLIVSCVYLLLG